MSHAAAGQGERLGHRRSPPRPGGPARRRHGHRRGSLVARAVCTDGLLDARLGRAGRFGRLHVARAYDARGLAPGARIRNPVLAPDPRGLPAARGTAGTEVVAPRRRGCRHRRVTRPPGRQRFPRDLRNAGDPAGAAAPFGLDPAHRPSPLVGATRAARPARTCRRQRGRRAGGNRLAVRRRPDPRLAVARGTHGGAADNRRIRPRAAAWGAHRNRAPVRIGPLPRIAVVPRRNTGAAPR